MACPSQTYAGLERDGISWTNWSKRFSGPVGSYFEPDSLADLVNVVQRASARSHMLHVVGSGWAFENIAWSPDWMVSLARLNRRLTNVTGSALNPQWAASQASGADTLFHIEAGATIADLNDALAVAGLAMPTLGGNVGQAVAGALSTSTHGGNPTQPPLADAVMAMHLVTGNGRELWIERASQPITDDVALALALPCPDAEIVRNDDLFNALLIGFGRFGVIYSYVLRVRQAFRLAEWTTSIPRTVLTTALRDGIAGGTFLAPLLTMLPTPPAALGALDLANPVGLEVVFDTNNLALCWLKRRWTTSDNTDLNIAGSENPLCQIGAAGVLAAGVLVLSGFVAAPFYGVAVSAKILELQASLAANPAMTAGEMLARVLAGFWDLGLGWAIPKISGVEFGQQYQASTTDGKRGPSNVILSASRADSQQMCFRADSIEPIFDAHATGYIDFLDTAIDAAVNRQQAGVHLAALVGGVPRDAEHAQISQCPRSCDRDHVPERAPRQPGLVHAARGSGGEQRRAAALGPDQHLERNDRGLAVRVGGAGLADNARDGGRQLVDVQQRVHRATGPRAIRGSRGQRRRHPGRRLGRGCRGPGDRAVARTASSVHPPPARSAAGCRAVARPPRREGSKLHAGARSSTDRVAKNRLASGLERMGLQC